MPLLIKSGFLKRKCVVMVRDMVDEGWWSAAGY